MRKSRRPAWQDQRPRSKEGRDTYSIAARNESMFADAFLDAMQSMISSEDAKTFKAAWNRGEDLDAVMETIPLLSAMQEDESVRRRVWQRFIDRIVQAYGTIIQQAGDAEAGNIKRDLGAKMVFSLSNEPMAKKHPDQSVEDEVSDTVDDVIAEAEPGLKAGYVVPVNPHSIDWMKAESLRLVTENVTENQIEVIRAILSDAFERGLRAEVALGNIRANIGLLPSHIKAVERRRIMLERARLPKDMIDKEIKKYREKLLRYRAKMIARTETISAQAHGRNTTWRLADDAGILPKVERTWTSAPESPNPTRPCVICLDLDGKRAKIGESYRSKFIGPIMSPPAHPHCRCTETLKKM